MNVLNSVSVAMLFETTGVIPFTIIISPTSAVTITEVVTLSVNVASAGNLYLKGLADINFTCIIAPYEYLTTKLDITNSGITSVLSCLTAITV